MTAKRELPNADDLVNRYLAGESIKSLAASQGFSRQVIYRLFKERNIPLRNRSAAMYVRMARTSPGERIRLSSLESHSFRVRFTDDAELSEIDALQLARHRIRNRFR